MTDTRTVTPEQIAITGCPTCHTPVQVIAEPDGSTTYRPVAPEAVPRDMRALAATILAQHPQPCRECDRTQWLDEDAGTDALLLHLGRVIERMLGMARAALRAPEQPALDVERLAGAMRVAAERLAVDTLIDLDAERIAAEYERLGNTK